jgi:hypothetical protein
VPKQSQKVSPIDPIPEPRKTGEPEQPEPGRDPHKNRVPASSIKPTTSGTDRSQNSKTSSMSYTLIWESGQHRTELKLGADTK